MPLTKQSGIASFKKSCSTPVENCLPRKCVPIIGELKVSPGHFGIQNAAEFGSPDREQLAIGHCAILETGSFWAGNLGEPATFRTFWREHGL